MSAPGDDRSGNEPPSGAAVSVVVTTYNRVDAATAAVQSIFDQTDPPGEVIVCDDGSTDGTEVAFRAWEQREERLRFLRNPVNAGRPAPARNMGIRAAHGEWIAFLDDDDVWLPDKLTVQLPLLDENAVVASNARRRSDGSPYFAPQELVSEPTPRDLGIANPIIQSTAIAPRRLLLAVGGFPTARWLRGIEDYALWLALADIGATFKLLPDALIEYDDTHEAPRLSRARTLREAAVAGVFMKRWLRRPGDRERASLALGRSLQAVNVAIEDVRRR
jgi:glycosyltransferase involved in cell wall biosynthesis